MSATKLIQFFSSLISLFLSRKFSIVFLRYILNKVGAKSAKFNSHKGIANPKYKKIYIYTFARREVYYIKL